MDGWLGFNAISSKRLYHARHPADNEQIMLCMRNDYRLTHMTVHNSVSWCRLANTDNSTVRNRANLSTLDHNRYDAQIYRAIFTNAQTDWLTNSNSTAASQTLTGCMDGGVFMTFYAYKSGYIMPEIVQSLLVRQMAFKKRNYSFRMNVIKEIFDIRSCIEILVNDIKIYTVDQ